MPNLLLDYLNKERENLILDGIQEVLPWLITLYNFKRIYKNADFSSTSFGFYLNVFEAIVPPETIKYHKLSILGNSPELKDYLKEALIKLESTRNATDFVYDNEHAIILSNRLIEYSVEHGDFSSFLISMILKSDYSILFKSQESEDVTQFTIPKINPESKKLIYEDIAIFLKSLALPPNFTLYLIAFVEGKIFSFSLTNDLFKLNYHDQWSHEQWVELKNTEYFASLDFEDTIKDKSGIRMVSNEEYIEESNKIANKINFSKLFIPEESNALYIVKDMQISLFPHNLFLNQEGDFVSQIMPVTNILSTEWFLKAKNSTPLKKNYSKSIWNPIDSGDVSLNYLHSKMEETLKANSFDIHTELNLATPLSSDINIICSHGDRDISEIHVVSQTENMTYNLNQVIGEGKILIFIVCHSGSMKTEFFKNSATSLMKRFLAKGYDSIIAPVWAFNVTIIEYWFPEFMIQINAGTQIDQAVFLANKKVYDRYPTPAAWACLHLFGNPFIKKEL